MDEKYVKQHYNSKAGQYHKLPGQQFHQILSLISTTHESRILDAGCGTGALLLKISESKPFKKAIGIDVSESEIAIAIQNNDDVRITFQSSSVVETPFDKNYFDIIVSNMVLHHVDDHLAAFNEMNRILNDKGLMIINTFGPNSLSEYTDLLSIAWQTIKGTAFNYSYLNPLDKKFIDSFYQMNNYRNFNIKSNTDLAFSITDASDIDKYLNYLDVVGGAWQLLINAKEIKAINCIIKNRIQEAIENTGTFDVTRTKLLITASK